MAEQPHTHTHTHARTRTHTHTHAYTFHGNFDFARFFPARGQNTYAHTRKDCPWQLRLLLSARSLHSI